jgi:hypothetical protein
MNSFHRSRSSVPGGRRGTLGSLYVAGLVSIALIASSGAARADGLSDLRATLARLPGVAPVRAALELSVVNRTKGESNRADEGRTRVQLASGPQGLSITYPETELAQAGAEMRAQRADPERRSPGRTALREVNGLDISEYLSFAGPLLARLERATLVEEHGEAYQGRPAKVLVLKLEPALRKEELAHLKETVYTMKLWLAGDGLPVAAETSLHGKAGILFLNFRNLSHETWEFARAADRLVVTKHHQEIDASGLGQEFHRRTTAVITLER